MAQVAEGNIILNKKADEPLRQGDDLVLTSRPVPIRKDEVMELNVTIDMNEALDEESIWSTIEERLIDKLITRAENKEGQITKALNEKFKDMIEQEMKIIAEKVVNKGLPVYNHCGQQTGCQPWDKVVGLAVEKYMNANTGSYHNEKMSRIEQIVSKYGDASFKSATIEIEKALQAETEKIITKVIAKTFKDAMLDKDINAPI